MERRPDPLCSESVEKRPDPLAIVSDPLATESLVAAVEAEARATAAGCGAVATFVGVVRGTHKGRRVRYLEYEAYAPLALQVFQRIVDEARSHWPDAVLAIHHRIGRLDVGEASVAIAAATPHRAEAFQACRYAIERIKQVAPIWKHEFFDDGDAWVEGAVADLDDDTARREALTRACA